MASDRAQPSAFAQPCQIRWAKVPGWQWWPAVVVPETEEQRQQLLQQQQEQGNGSRALPNLVRFLVDNTMARCPQLPFDAHYNRFLNVAYSDKRLMQAVEEARALLLDSSLWQPVSPRQLALQQAAGQEVAGGSEEHQAEGTQQPQQPQQPVLLPYPAPLQDDAAKRSSKQLLKWLQAAALAPEGPYNGLKDQQTRRVLHAVRSSRHVDCEAPAVGAGVAAAATRAEAPAAAPPARQQPAPPSWAPAAAPAVEAAAPDSPRPAKRQRKPTGLLLQSSTRLPSLLHGTTPAGCGPAAAAGMGGGDRSAAGVKRGLWGPTGARPGGGCRPGQHQQQQQQQGLRPPLAQRSSSSNQLAVGGCKRAVPEVSKPAVGRASRFQLLRRSGGGGGSGSGSGGVSSAASRSSSSSGEHGGRRPRTCSPPPSKRGCHQEVHAGRVRAVTPELMCTPEPDSSSEEEEQQQANPWDEQDEEEEAAGQFGEAEVEEEKQHQQVKEEQQEAEEPSKDEEEEEEETDDDDDEILLLPRSGLLRPSTSRVAAATGAATTAAAKDPLGAQPPAPQQAAAAAAAAAAGDPDAAAADGDVQPAPAPAAAADGAFTSSSPPTPTAAGGKSPGSWYHPITRLRRLSTPEDRQVASDEDWLSSDEEQEEEDDADEETETDEPEPELPLAVTRGRRVTAGKKLAGTKRTRQQQLQQHLRGTYAPPLPPAAGSAAGAGGAYPRVRQQARRGTPRVTPTLTTATTTSAAASHTATATPTSQGGGAAGPAGGSSSICQPWGPLHLPGGYHPGAAIAAYLGSCRGAPTSAGGAGASPSDVECVRSDTAGVRTEDEARRLLLPVDCGRLASLFDPSTRLPLLGGASSPRFAGYVPGRCRAVKTKSSVQQQQQPPQARPQQQQCQQQQKAGHKEHSSGLLQPHALHPLLHPHRHPLHPHHQPPHGFQQGLMLPGSSPPLGPWASDVMVPAWDLLHGPPGPSSWVPAAPVGRPHASASPGGSPGARGAAAGGAGAAAAAAAAATADGLDEVATLGRSGSTMGGLDCMGLVEEAPLCCMDDLFQLADQEPLPPEDLEAALSGQAAAASSREGSLAPDSGAGGAGARPLVGGAWEGGGSLAARAHGKQAGPPGSAHRRSSSGSGSDHDTLDMPWEWEVHKDTPADPELQADLEAAAASEAAAAQRSLLRLKRLPSTGGASDPDLSTPHFPPRHPRLRASLDPAQQAAARVVVVEAGAGAGSGSGSASSSSAATVLRQALVGLAPGGDALQYLAEQLLSCREELAACRAARAEAEQSQQATATQLSAAQASLEAAKAGQEDAQQLLVAKKGELTEAQQRATQLEMDLQQLQAQLTQQAAAGAAAGGAAAPAEPSPPQQQQCVQGQLRGREVELAAARKECERLRSVVAQGQHTGAVMAGHILSGVLASPGLTPAEKDKLRSEMHGMLTQVCTAPQQLPPHAPRPPAAPTAEVK